MKQDAAHMCPSIKIVTSLVLLMAVGFFVGSFFDASLLFGAIAVAMVSALCYLWAPVAYELSGGQLIVIFRLGEKQFGPVVRCSTVEGRIPMTIRLWGNGGLFAGTGIYWNKTYGVFRAYVTRAKPSAFVLVETPSTKVLISPENPTEFLSAAGAVAGSRESGPL